MDIAALEILIRTHALHMLRVMTAVWLLPQFGAGTGTRLQRLAIGLVLGLSVAVSTTDPASDPGSDPLRYGLLCGQEILLGCLLGWMTSLLIEIGSIAGSLIATEMGMHMSAQVDPASKMSLPLIAFLWRNIAIVLFFSSGGHYLVVGAFMESYAILPVGSFPAAGLLQDCVIVYASAVIAAGLRLAAPVFFVLCIVTVSVGFLAKMAPRLHVLEASFPIRIVSSIVLMVIFMPAMVDTLDTAFAELTELMLMKLAGH